LLAYLRIEQVVWALLLHHHGEPREGPRVDRRWQVVPGVAAEHLVGRLAGQRDGGFFLDRAEQQVQRGVHVAAELRVLPGAQDRGAQAGIAQLGGVERDVGMVTAQVGHRLCDVRRVGRAAHLVGTEPPAVVDEVHRERADALVLEGERGHDGRVETAGEQAAQRYVRHELPLHDVFQQAAHRTDGGGQVVGVLAGLQ
jgi:hypothetical protein